MISIFPLSTFQNVCSNIPAAPAYGVFISQLIRYSKACGFSQDFLNRGLLLTRHQGFLLVKLKSSFRKFYGHRHVFVDRYGIPVSQMTTDVVHLSLFVLLYFFIWLLCCMLFFDIWILITSLWYPQTLLPFYFRNVHLLIWNSKRRLHILFNKKLNNFSNKYKK